MPAVARARHGRYEGPKWASRFPDTPEGFDAMRAHQDARALPDDTDPDSIDDPGVREAFLERLQAGEEGGPVASGGGRASRRRGTRGRTSRGGRASSPTLRPPSRFSAADGTGFMLGLVLYAVGLNYLRYGKAGVTAFLKAKFLNRDNTLDTAGAPGLRGLLNPVPKGPPAKPPGIFPTPGPTSKAAG